MHYSQRLNRDFYQRWKTYTALTAHTWKALIYRRDSITDRATNTTGAKIASRFDCLAPGNARYDVGPVAELQPLKMVRTLEDIGSSFFKEHVAVGA